MRRTPVNSDKRRKPQTVQDKPDRGPQERWQHGVLQLQRMDDRGTTAVRAMTECTLDILQHQGAVSTRMAQAGLQLRKDYVGAKIEPRRTMRYVPDAVRPGKGQGELYVRSEREEQAYKRWRQALQVVGVGLSEALVTVCCLDHKPTRTQHRQLVEGLEALVKYYKI